MAQRTLKDSLRVADDRNKAPSTRQGTVVAINPIGRQAKIRLAAGTAPVDVLIPSTIDPTTLTEGMVVAVNMEQRTLYVTAVIGGKQPPNSNTANERTLNSVLDRLARLEALVASMIADSNAGTEADKFRDALYNQIGAGSGGNTQETKL